MHEPPKINRCTVCTDRGQYSVGPGSVKNQCDDSAMPLSFSFCAGICSKFVVCISGLHGHQ